MPVDASCFSPDYIAARARFRSSTMALQRALPGAELKSWGIGQTGPDGEELTIDVAVLGAARPDKVVVVSSALHGVEGFLGSAAQAALLEEVFPKNPPPATTRVVLLHALNPYGFAFLRRVNEDNVDLNRNFLLPDEPYAGSPDGYDELDSLLNPQVPPSSFEPFLAKAAFTILRKGLPALKNSVAGGQYDFPKGVFFGGHGPSRTMSLLDQHLPGLVGDAPRVFHVDFHSGLGAKGSYKLLVDHAAGTPGADQLLQRFGSNVQPWDKSGVSYSIRGGLGTWAKHKFGDRYDVLVAEFGTVHILSVIKALRTENQAHQWGGPEHPWTKRAKELLQNTFAPPDRAWRDEVVGKAVAIVERALA
jgi:hypothetical protein